MGCEGRIQKALSGFYYVNTGHEILTCRARGKFRKEGVSPLVGDRVQVRELGNGEGFVEAVLPRKNAFARPAVANIDQLVVIASGAIPRTDPFLIDRVASIAALKGCGVVVLLNKCDLDRADDLYAVYTAAGFPTLRVSAETGGGHRGIEAPDRREAVRLYRQLRRRKVQHSERAGPGISPPGGGCEPGSGPGTAHHPACGALPPLLRGGRGGLPGLLLL